jgi:hypothetical protein
VAELSFIVSKKRNIPRKNESALASKRDLTKMLNAKNFTVFLPRKPDFLTTM